MSINLRVGGCGKGTYVVDDDNGSMYLTRSGKVEKYEHSRDKQYFFDSIDHGKKVMEEYLSKQKQEQTPMNLTIFNGLTGQYHKAVEQEYVLVYPEGDDSSPLVYNTVNKLQNNVDFLDSLEGMLKKGKVTIEKRKMIVI